MNKTARYTLFLFITITLITFGISFLFNLIGRTYEFTPVGRLFMMLFSSITGGAIVTLLVISTAPVLKNYLTTFRQLVRLDTLSHPLLLKLQKAAPSTFQHSLQVGNLANHAAKSIGADSFLTRIGGYYHDIGKIQDANFYIENRPQGQTASPGETPKSMFHKIKNHIHEGLKLAREYKLPYEVQVFIPEHHGTLVAAIPYENARKMNPKVRKSEYRYNGPKPSSKETALVMLADAIESKIRTLSEITPENITDAVDTIIDSRVSDGQLELSGLTKTDLKQVRSAFIEEAKVLYHQRIKYPDQVKTEGISDNKEN